jgi:hypothetical protein
MKHSDVVAVREALRGLDDERAPDLWPEIRRRRELAPAAPTPVRGRRLGPVLVAAAMIVAIAVAAVVLRAGNETNDTDRAIGAVPRSFWTVTDRIEVRDLGAGARLLATTGGTAAVGTRGGTALALVDQRTADLETAVVPVPATAALAGDGDRVWLLTSDGTLVRVDRDGAVTTVAELGRADGVDPTMVASGGAVFVAGTDAGALVRVDPDSGSVSAVPVGAPRALAATDRWLWAVLEDGRRVVRVDPRTLELATDVRTEPVTAIAADGEQAYVLHGDSGTVDRIAGDGTTNPLTRVATSVSGIIVAGGHLWATDGGVLTAYDLESGEAARPLALGLVREQGLARGSDALWVIGPGAELLRIGPG